MLIETIKDLFQRDLNRLKREIELYKDESAMWQVSGDITNSGGNLALHLIGNLKTFIGAGLGGTDYIRQRDREFSAKGIERSIIIAEIEETIEIVNHGLSQVGDHNSDIDFPITIWDKPTDMMFTIFHLHSHLNYHLGQVNYHRRLCD